MPAVGSPDDGGDCEDCHGDNDQKKEKVELKTIENGRGKALTSVFHFHCRNANTNRQTELNVKV